MKLAAPPHPLLVAAALATALAALVFLFPVRRGLAVLRADTDAVIIPDAAPAGPRLLIGILTVPQKHERRHILRLAYSLQRPPLADARVDIRYVLCNVTGDDAVLVAMEMEAYNDIVILNCTENMNDGKTFTYFSSVPSIFPGADQRPPYDYVMKADDDTYLRLGNLVGSLRDKPREDVYYGAGMGFEPGDPLFMRGMGYILSWDLVEWIAASDVPVQDRTGVEDIFLGKWLNDKNKGRRRFNMNETMYDYRGGSDGDFAPATIAVHVLKDNGRWARTLRHFAAADGIPPSKLDHLP